MPQGEGYGSGEGRMKSDVGKPATMQNSKQPGPGMSYPRGAFGKGGGKSKTVDGVMFEGDAGQTQVNNGNYNEVGSTARRFG